MASPVVGLSGAGCSIAFSSIVCVGLWWMLGLVALATENVVISYQPAAQLCELQQEKIRESSGLAASRRSSERFWTHNDRGDEPRLFAFGMDGQHLGTSHVIGAEAADWEDLASFVAADEAYLAIGDLGDNDLSRAQYTIYVVKEPVNPKKDSSVERQIDFRYEDGSHDCEALGFDVLRGEFLLAEKRKAPRCRVYALPWPRRSEEGVAKMIATIDAEFVTAMDISADGLRAIVLTRRDARVYTRSPEESWATAFARPAQPIAVPPRRQGETICFGADGVTLYLTSEKRPTPFFQIAPTK